VGIEREIGDTSPPKESKDSLQWRKANPACSNQQDARKARDHKPKMATHSKCFGDVMQANQAKGTTDPNHSTYKKQFQGLSAA